MKPFLIVLISCFLFACSNKVDNDKTVNPPNPYAKIKKGKFSYKDEVQGDLVMVARQDSIQKEFLVYRNLEVHFDIKWLNDSTYKLRYNKTVSNPQNIELPDDIEQLIKYCDVVEISDSTYVERAITRLNTDTIYTTYQIL